MRQARCMPNLFNGPAVMAYAIRWIRRHIKYAQGFALMQTRYCLLLRICKAANITSRDGSGDIRSQPIGLRI